MAKGLIYKGSYAGWYSISDECFYTSSQITRVPSTKPNEPDSINSTDTGSSVSWHEEQNYMFRLSSFRDFLLEHYTSHPDVIYPRQHHDYILDILSGGPLDDLSISRPRERLEWGVRVPGDEAHTVYVWFDALLVYLSGIGYPWGGGVSGVEKGWPADLQVIGKDIIRYGIILLTDFNPKDTTGFTQFIFQQSSTPSDSHFPRNSSLMLTGQSIKRKCRNPSGM
jgi:methionyl-tRNA synthetase